LSAPDPALLPREPEPGSPVFAEPWHAEVLALAHGLTRAGLFTASEWADALGAEIRRSGDLGQPDTEATYYAAALAALQGLVAARSPAVGDRLHARVEAWRRAYLNTPHGRPVTLAAAEGAAPEHGGHHPHHHHHGHDYGRAH
jgi:nitrile hydratase accessory protein